MEEKVIEDNIIVTKEEPIKKKLELDIDVTPNNTGTNPFQKWVHLAKTIDAWRIFPRIFVSVYIVLLYGTTRTKLRTISVSINSSRSYGGSLWYLRWHFRAK